jgi:2-amino-4-hydroxy-6-hydroxymethyldihydropteridine diphosphokinase
MAEIFVGLGANLGEPADNLRTAVHRLGRAMDVRLVSSLYRSEPVGVRAQPDFLNAVVGGTTTLDPGALVALFLEIEREAGRVRTVPMGPRTLDLDLLLYDDLVTVDPAVEVPHPRMVERRFVLEPLAEIAPDVLHPVLGRSAAELLARLPDGPEVERITLEGWPPTG